MVWVGLMERLLRGYVALAMLLVTGCLGFLAGM